MGLAKNLRNGRLEAVDGTRELRPWEQEASSREMASPPFPPVMEESGEEDRGWCFLGDPRTSSQDLGTAGGDAV